MELPKPDASNGSHVFRYAYEYGGRRAGTHLVDYLRTLYRRRVIAVSTFVIVLASVAAYTFTATPVYQACAQLLLAPENPNVVGFKEVIEPEKSTNEYYQTRSTMLRSRSLARRTMDALNLWDHPEFSSGPSRTRPETSGPGEDAAQTKKIDAFLSKLTVRPLRNSSLVDVLYELPQADLATRVVNMLVNQYIEQDLEFRFLSTKEAADWLSVQLADQRKKLEDSELALQRYREQGDAVALEDRQNIVVQRLADLNAAVTRARTARIEKEALYRQLASLEADRPSLDTFPGILANSFIQQLKTQQADLKRQQKKMAESLGEKHPDMIKLAAELQTTETQLDAEINKVVQSVKNEYLSAQAQERTLAADLERQKGDALALNRAGIEYSVLSREAESNKQIYESLLQRAKETGISGELKTSGIRVVDFAEVPREPVRPNKRTDLLLGLFGGLIAGVGLAFFLEYFDRRVKNPEEIQRFLGVPFLGMVPAVAANGNGDTARRLIEAFGTICTNVIVSSAGEKSKTISVTSSQPGEGKTVVASNLALALANSGKRVLILDADMRRPRQHQVFRTRREPGLSSLLAGEAKASEAICKTETPGLWLLPSGPLPPNPADLLRSDTFERFLDTLGDQFDWIVIDSPPVLTVTDPAVVAHRSSGVVFVVGSEQVDRAMAQRAVEQLTAARANILGAVLNRVNVDKDPYYYARYRTAAYSNQPARSQA